MEKCSYPAGSCVCAAAFNARLAAADVTINRMLGYYAEDKARITALEADLTKACNTTILRDQIDELMSQVSRQSADLARWKENARVWSERNDVLQAAMLDYASNRGTKHG